VNTTWLVTWLVAAVAACGGDTVHHLADGGADGNSGGSGSGTPEPCAITISSSALSGSTGSGTCTPTLVNNATIAVAFDAVASATDSGSGTIACQITPGVESQALDKAACTIEVDHVTSTNGILDEWDDSPADATVTMSLTDLAPVSGTLQLTLDDGSGSLMTVSGTF
jgi:hypothetical protein